MAGSRRRQLRVGLIGALAGSLVLLLGACGAISTKDDRALAEKLVDKHFPGQLDVIEARSLFPGTGGSEITLSVTDDRDAVVRLGVDSEKGTCDYKACGQALTEAVARGRTQAADLRTLTSTFDKCGYDVLAFDPAGTGPYVAARPTNATMTRVLADIGECVRSWVAADRPDGWMARRNGVGVKIVSPKVAGERDTGKESWPTAMRLSHTGLLASLAERPYFSAGYKTVRGRVDTAVRTHIVRPFDLREEFGRTVERAVSEELRATYPDVVAHDYPGTWLLEPGRVDRQRGYVLFCEQPVADKSCVGDHAVLVTTDVRGNPVGEMRIIRDVRDGTGPLRLPPL